MRLNFASYDNQDVSELLCPNCGSKYLHHNKVEIFDRNEDSDHGIHVFECENCSATPYISVNQHKGTTFIDFSFDK